MNKCLHFEDGWNAALDAVAEVVLSKETNDEEFERLMVLLKSIRATSWKEALDAVAKKIEELRK
jgi:endonuclease III